MTQVFKFVERWEQGHRPWFWEMMKDPHALDWLKEYKARKMSERNDIPLKTARAATRRKCFHVVKVNKFNVPDVVDYLHEQDVHDYYQSANKFMFASDEVATAIKVFYS